MGWLDEHLKAYWALLEFWLGLCSRSSIMGIEIIKNLLVCTLLIVDEYISRRLSIVNAS
jgi:hypothetical protein